MRLVKRLPFKCIQLWIVQPFLCKSNTIDPLKKNIIFIICKNDLEIYLSKFEYAFLNFIHIKLNFPATKL